MLVGRKNRKEKSKRNMSSVAELKLVLTHEFFNLACRMKQVEIKNVCG